MSEVATPILPMYDAATSRAFSTAGMAYLYVDDADTFRQQIIASGVTTGDPGPDLRERWSRTHDVSRVGAIEDKPWRMREFALLDPVNNLLRVGHSLR